MNVCSIPDSLSCHTRKIPRLGMSTCSFCYWYRYVFDRRHLLSRSAWRRFAPKSPFFCFNKSPIRYGFWQQCRHKLNKYHKRNRSKWRNKEKDICILVVRVTIRVYENKPHLFFGKDLPKLSSAPMCVAKIRVKTVKVWIYNNLEKHA